MSRVSDVPRFRYRFLSALFCALSFFVFAGHGVAQNPTSQNIDRAQLLGTQPGSPFAPEVTPNGVQQGEAAASPNDTDLGEQQILKRVEEYQPFTASVAAPFYYTSNVALTHKGVHGDFLVAPVAGVFYEPRITRTLYAFIDVRQQFFYYNHYNSFDFGSLDAEAGLIYSLPQLHNLVLRGEYDFNRLTFSDRILDEFYSNHSLIASAELPFRIGRAQQLSLGTDVNISVAADHESPRRNDYGVFLGHSVFLTRSLSLDSVGRVVVRDYYHGNRTDVSEILAVSANYRLTSWWTASVITSFAASQSNHSVFSYNVANVGGAIALSAKF
jgi:hypothetical protein